MKRITAFLLALLTALGLSASASAEAWTFERGITIVCPWGRNGGADSTLRPMSALLEEYLGVPVEVRNETGESGVVGASYACAQPADGYTFLLGTQSLYLQDLLGKMDFDFRKEFECEVVLVHSINLLAGSKKQMESYGIESFSDLRAYAAAHPGEVSVALQSAVGVDGMCLEIATSDLALRRVAYNSGDEANSDLAEGRVDLAVGGYDDMSERIESGEIVPLLLFCEHRIAILPECECTAELGIESYAGPWRAIFAKKGTPQGAIDAIVEAVEACRKDATWQVFIREAAYDQREIPPTGGETQSFCLYEYKDIRDYLLELGTLAKDYEELR